MRILLLTQIVPYPPDSGPRIKTYHVLRYLAQRHEVHLVSFVRTDKEHADAQTLRRFCASVTTVPLRRSRLGDVVYLGRSLFSGRPFLIERDDAPAMRRKVRQLVRQYQFDAVHADQLSMAQFAVGLPVRTRVLDEHNAVWTIVRRSAAGEGRGLRRLAAELEWRKLRAYEGRICPRFDWVTVVSGQDLADLERAAGRRIRAAIIPIAVDAGALAFRQRQPEAQAVLSVATMFYPPNVEGVLWFAREVFPLVRRIAAGSRFLVVGSRPPETVRRLAAAESGIEVTGYVPDLGPVLEQSAVLVVPLHSGSGMRVKILEAFSRGIPVVSTGVGVEGIDAVPGEHLLVADSPEGFAEAVVQLLRDRGLAARLARAGRALVEERYDWRSALMGLDSLYPASAAPPASPPPGVVGPAAATQR